MNPPPRAAPPAAAAATPSPLSAAVAAPPPSGGAIAALGPGAPPPGGGGGGGGSSASPTSPPPPGAASLVEQLNRRVLVCLRDGRLLLGTLAAYDQYANVALDAPVERVIVDGSYADVPAGAAVVIRGENVMLVGEVRGGV